MELKFTYFVFFNLLKIAAENETSGPQSGDFPIVRKKKIAPIDAQFHRGSNHTHPNPTPSHPFYIFHHLPPQFPLSFFFSFSHFFIFFFFFFPRAAAVPQKKKKKNRGQLHDRSIHTHIAGWVIFLAVFFASLLWVFLGVLYDAATDPERGSHGRRSRRDPVRAPLCAPWQRAAPGCDGAVDRGTGRRAVPNAEGWGLYRLIVDAGSHAGGGGASLPGSCRKNGFFCGPEGVFFKLGVPVLGWKMSLAVIALSFVLCWFPMLKDGDYIDSLSMLGVMPGGEVLLCQVRG
jgi:hypothetical protein